MKDSLVKHFTRIVSDKIICNVVVQLEELTATVKKPTEVRIEVSRGPHKEQTPRIEILPDKSQYELDHTWTRASQFWLKNDQSQEKTCVVTLTAFIDGDKFSISKAIDIGPMIGKEKITSTLELESNKTELSDDTVVGGTVTGKPWRKLKKDAMEPNYNTDTNYVKQ